jgi:hypothetical protein
MRSYNQLIIFLFVEIAKKLELVYNILRAVSITPNKNQFKSPSIGR